MKKIVIIIVSVVLVSAILFGVAMGIKKYKEDNALATADTVFAVSNNVGTIIVNEDVARELLGHYPQEVLGISQPLNKYIMKLSETTLFNDTACLIELYLTEEDTEPQATFAIKGYDCFVYDEENDEFLLLTLNGAFPVENNVSTESDTTALFYDEANNVALHKIIDKFTKEELGFQKAPYEYIMVATGVSVVASDGSTVYVVKMYEQDGTATNYTCAFRDGVVYRYDTIQKLYTTIA